MASRLFEFIAGRHAGPWGAVLDAGTGVHSAGWLAGQPTESLTLVTAARAHADQVRRSVPLRPGDRLLLGDWADPAFLADEAFDTVLADYLVGAVEAFAPYFQQGLFDRLAQLARGRLYLIGVDPYVVVEPETASGRLVWEIGRFRDACLLLAGDHPYREYPAEWVLAQLDRVGFAVIEARRFPIRYKAAFIDSQIDMALMRLPALSDQPLREALRVRGEALRRAGHAAVAAEDGIRHGSDYVIVAERRA